MFKRNNPYLPFLIVILIGVATFFILSPVLKCDFVNFDDEIFIKKNPLIINETIDLKRIFTSVVVKNDYYPVTILSLAYNFKLGKLDPSGYHLWNLLIHVFNTLLVFIFIYILTKRNLLMAVIVSFFFGIHPMHVESVAWVTERKDVLFLFFFMAGLITYLKFENSNKIFWYFITLVLFVLSCLSKVTAVVFPFILLLVDYLLLTELNKKDVLNKIPFFIISVFFMLITYKLHQTGTLMEGVRHKSLLYTILSASYQLLMYSIKLVYPFGLSVFYQNFNESNLPLFFYLSPILLAVIAGYVFYYLRKQKEIIFGVLFFILSIGLMLQIIPTGGGNFIMADRYTYLPYIGLLFIIAYFMNLVWNSKLKKLQSIKIPFALIILLGGIIFSIQTYSRTKVWKNSEVLFSDAIANDSTASFPYYSRGIYRASLNQQEAAFKDLNKSIELDTAFDEAYNARGIYYSNSGNYNAALTDYNMAINLRPGFAEAYDNRGWAYFQLNNIDLAITNYKKAIELNPDYANTYNNLGVAYSNTNNSKDALVNYNKALELNPMFTNARINRAKERDRTNDFNGALEDWNYLSAQQPNEPKVYYSRGMTYLKMNDNSNACADFKEAAVLGSRNAEDAMQKYCH